MTTAFAEVDVPSLAAILLSTQLETSATNRQSLHRSAIARAAQKTYGRRRDHLRKHSFTSRSQETGINISRHLTTHNIPPLATVFSSLLPRSLPQFNSHSFVRVTVITIITAFVFFVCLLPRSMSIRDLRAPTAPNHGGASDQVPGDRTINKSGH